MFAINAKGTFVWMNDDTFVFFLFGLWFDLKRCDEIEMKQFQRNFISKAFHIIALVMGGY